MKQPIFIISKANLFEAWLKAKRTADKSRYAWNWGKGGQYNTLSLLQSLPETVSGYCAIHEVTSLLDSIKCHYAYPMADSALQGILSEMRPLREKLHEVEERNRQRLESQPKGYFHASYKGVPSVRPEFGYVIRHKNPNP